MEYINQAPDDIVDSITTIGFCYPRRGAIADVIAEKFSPALDNPAVV